MASFTHVLGTDQVDISQLRVPYSTTRFTEDQLVSRSDPFQQFHSWLQTALKCDEIKEATAICLSTSTSEGKPSSRMLLVKKYSERGFQFFTNYNSRKGRELTENPYASILFFWPPLHRQVRVEGRVERLSEEESAPYFHSRPHGSQISAAVSTQSAEIPSRDELERKHKELLEKYPDESMPVPKPPHWGGFLLVPSMFEFWQGQSNRLHDRIVFSRTEGSSTWTLKRLAP